MACVRVLRRVVDSLACFPGLDHPYLGRARCDQALCDIDWVRSPLREACSTTVAFRQPSLFCGLRRGYMIFVAGRAAW